MKAEDVIGCMQAVLELSSMIAPRTYLELRLKGFALEVCSASQTVFAHFGTEQLPGWADQQLLGMSLFVRFQDTPVLLWDAPFR